MEFIGHSCGNKGFSFHIKTKICRRYKFRDVAMVIVIIAAARVPIIPITVVANENFNDLLF